jgi:menaquinol-cytochrome c reductase iron-sulfur subunit
MNRRDLYRFGTVAVGGLISLALAVPGVAYLLDPLFKKRASDGDFETLTSLSQLKVGVPQSFSIIEERRDAWVKYPPQPIGSVWLVRQPPGATEPVVAFTAECPHLGCAVNLSADRRFFFCPCHTSSFNFDGTRKNEVPPRGMDSLQVKLSNDSDPLVSVKFERFRPQTKEKTPLA